MSTRGKLLNPDDVGYDVILLIGQSNMSGFSGSTDARLDTTDPRIFQYGGSGTYSGVISQAVEPLATADAAGTPPTGASPGMAFARWYLHTIPANRRVLLVPAPKGSTGFEGTSTSGVWKPGVGTVTNLYENAITQTQNALAAAGANSRLVAALWIQGETDGDNGTTGPTYQADLDSLIDGLRSRLSAPNLPIIIGGMVPEYLSTGTRAAIAAVHAATPQRRNRTAYVAGISGHNRGDGNHYDATGARLMGRALFDALATARANTAPLPPLAPPSVTPTQSGTSLVVTWGDPGGTVTDYKVEYQTNGSGSWTTFAHAPSTTRSATITGLTLGATYNVRVSTVNSVGISSPQTVTGFVMATAPSQVTGLATGAPASNAVPLSWTAVSGATSYLVEYKLSTDSTWTAGPTPSSASATVSGLSASTGYDFRVTARNAAGSGSPSATVSATTTAPVAPGGPLMSSVTAAPARAYSLRKVNSGYAGSAIRVRRSSDNTEQDIAFSGNNLDTTSLLSFAGSGSAYIKTWYDQSGNARDLTQATAANQPRIVNAGVLDTANSLPTAVFDGTASYFVDTNPSLYAAGASSIATVLKASGKANMKMVSESSSSSSVQAYVSLMSSASAPNKVDVFIRNDANAIPVTDTAAGPAVLNGTLNQLNVVDTGAEFDWSMNAAAAIVKTYTRAGTLTLNRFAVGALVNTSVSSYFQGSISELVIWGSALSLSDQAASASNQKSVFSTP